MAFVSLSTASRALGCHLQFSSFSSISQGHVYPGTSMAYSSAGVMHHTLETGDRLHRKRVIVLPHFPFLQLFRTGCVLVIKC